MQVGKPKEMVPNLSPRLAGRKQIDISIDFLRYKVVKHRTFPGQKIYNFNKTGSRNQNRSIEHKKIPILTKSELRNPSGRPKHAQNTFSKIRRLQSTPIDLHPNPS